MNLNRLETKEADLRIQFAGPSGVGKTTLANDWIGLSGVAPICLPFISGSMSDLLPSTKDIPHSEMLKKDKQELYQEDFQLLTLRNKKYSQESRYVTDRSYLDSAAYFLYKQSSVLPQCEVEHFLELCKKCLTEDVDLLIVLGFTPYMVKNWVIEDNKKRITNKYFQAQISYIMRYIIADWGFNFSNPITYIRHGFFKRDDYLVNGAYYEGCIRNMYGSVKVLWIDEPNLDKRKDIITSYIKSL